MTRDATPPENKATDKEATRARGADATPGATGAGKKKAGGATKGAGEISAEAPRAATSGASAKATKATGGKAKGAEETTAEAPRAATSGASAKATKAPGGKTKGAGETTAEAPRAATSGASAKATKATGGKAKSTSSPKPSGKKPPGKKQDAATETRGEGPAGAGEVATSETGSGTSGEDGGSPVTNAGTNASEARAESAGPTGIPAEGAAGADADAVAAEHPADGAEGVEATAGKATAGPSGEGDATQAEEGQATEGQAAEGQAAEVKAAGGKPAGLRVSEITADTIASAFEPISSRPELREAAQRNLLRWLREKEFSPYHAQIKSLIAAKRWELLFDSFYQVLPFGTGGRRGPVGVGTNRFNPWTLSASVQGHVAWLKEKILGEKIGARKKPLHVVIAYDVRRYQDSNNVYERSVPNPSLGLSSREFAEIAAGVYAGNGVSVTLLPPESDTFVSTPELSFAIRHLKADGGLNVSASHNPPDDNGGKFYNALGGQEVPPDDERMATLVDQVEEITSIPYKQARSKGLVKDYAPSIHDAYIAANVATSLAPSFRGARVVFTGLHGTGDTTVVEVLKAAGFVVAVEPTQASHDGAFPEVPFRTPNPEVRQSMERAVALADKLGYELVMACDPDADRIGLYARSANGKYRFFTGNEIGALVTDWRLRARGGRGGIVMKTEVTTELITRIAKAANATVVGDLLVGFKYIGEGLRLLEETGQFQNASGGVADFVVGIEESHGVLVTPALRDKDAAGAALALAEFASSLLPEGKTLADALGALWVKHGYVHNELVSTVMRGAAGRARIETIQASMRKSPPDIIGDFEVTEFLDRLDPEGPLGPILSGTDAASRDVMVFRMGPDRRLILRPSGTEPKNKVYVECVGRKGATLFDEIPRVAQEAKELALAFVEEMLSRVDIKIPNWALRVSDLVAIEQKMHFAQEFIPTLKKKLAAGEEVDAWIDATLKPYGKDPRGLVAEAMTAWEATVEDGSAAAAVKAVLGTPRR